MCVSVVDLADPRIRRIVMLMRAGDWHERDDKPTCPRCGRGSRGGLCSACRRAQRLRDDPEAGERRRRMARERYRLRKEQDTPRRVKGACRVCGKACVKQDDGLCGACRRMARYRDDPEYRGRILRDKQRYRNRNRSRK